MVRVMDVSLSPLECYVFLSDLELTFAETILTAALYDLCYRNILKRVDISELTGSSIDHSVSTLTLLIPGRISSEQSKIHQKRLKI